MPKAIIQVHVFLEGTWGNQLCSMRTMIILTWMLTSQTGLVPQVAGQTRGIDSCLERWNIHVVLHLISVPDVTPLWGSGGWSTLTMYMTWAKVLIPDVGYFNSHLSKIKRLLLFSHQNCLKEKILMRLFKHLSLKKNHQHKTEFPLLNEDNNRAVSVWTPTHVNNRPIRASEYLYIYVFVGTSSVSSIHWPEWTWTHCPVNSTVVLNNVIYATAF